MFLIVPIDKGDVEYTAENFVRAVNAYCAYRIECNDHSLQVFVVLHGCFDIIRESTYLYVAMQRSS